MALFSSSLLAGLVVVTLFIVGGVVGVVTVVGMVMDDVVRMDDGSGFDVGINVVNISAMLVLVTGSVLCQPKVVNSSSSLVRISVPTSSGLAPSPTRDLSNSVVGLVTVVTSTSSSPVTLLLSV